MEIQVPNFQDRRQFGRIKISEPTLCQVYVPQSRQLKGYRGLIQNISLGGMYFVCDEKPPLDKDDIRHLIFNVVHKYHKLYRLLFHALVVRTEKHGSKFGVALKLLSDPIYYPLKETEDGELPSLDKTLILYKYYQLYRKAYEVIKMSPDVRTERIRRLKKRIASGSYKIEPVKLARDVTETHFKEDILIRKT